MNEGVEIAPDVAAGAQSRGRGAGHERRRRPDGAALPARRGARLMALAGSPAASSVGEVVADLEISAAWLVDPVSGREGPGEIVVTRRRPRVGRLARRRRGERRRRPRGRRGARVHRPPRPLPRAGQRGRRDGRVRAGGGGPRRIHDGLPDAEHDAGARRSGRARAGPGGGRRVRVAGSGAGVRRGVGGPWRARRWRRSASWPMRASSGSPTTDRRSAPASSCGTRSPTPARSGCRSSTTPRTRR